MPEAGNVGFPELGPEEAERVAELDRHDILDTPPEQCFDDLALLASRICDTPVALVSLVSSDRQWLKARVGFEAREMSLDQSVCKFALDCPGLLIIPDLTADPRTGANPLVTGHPNLRFYAGAPLRTSTGAVLGTLCVIDSTSRPSGLTAAQSEALEVLAKQVVAQMELRLTLANFEAAKERLGLAVDIASLGLFNWDMKTGAVTVDDGARAIYGFRPNMEPREEDLFRCVHSDDVERVTDEYRRARLRQGKFRIVYRINRSDGETRFIETTCVIPDPLGNASEAFGIWKDVTEYRRLEQQRTAEETARQEAELRLQVALDAADLGTWSLNLTDNTSIRSLRHDQMFGYPELQEHWGEETAERHVLEEDRHIYTEALQQARITGHLSFVVRIRDRAGSIRWIEPVGRAEYNGQGVPERLSGTIADITERKLAENELRSIHTDLERRVAERAQERSQLWELSPDLLGVLNSSGFFDATNPAWHTILGWSAHMIRRTHFSDFLHPDDFARNQAAFDKMKRGVPVFRLENRLRTKQGDYRWMSWSAVPEDSKVYCSARDITEEKAQADLLNQRTLERDRAWSLSQELLVVALPDGTLEAINPIWTMLLGWQAHEIVGTNFIDYAHPDDMDATLLAFAGILERPLVVPFEYRFRHRDGSYRWFGWTGTFEGGKVYASGRNLTLERDQAEALRQSQKMEAIGQLTGGVAHDFNNLLTVIKSSTDLLKRPSLPEERRLRYVGAISDTVDRAAKLTAQLLAFARRQTLKPEVFDVCDAVRAISDMMDPLTGGRITLKTDFPARPLLVNADPSQFDTALINMAVNARDAMGGQGELTLRVQAVEGIPAIRAHPGITAPCVTVSFTDTGSGIEPEVLIKIFEPFFTTKEVGKGTGLGLSQVFGFAKQSGGEIMVESVVGKGTTFTLYLPRTAEKAHDAVIPENDEEPTPGHGLCVLFVEDNKEIGGFSAAALIDLGYRPVLVVGADEALAELTTDAVRFDVVFSDVVMPGMNGVELGRQIRLHHPDLPVVLTSGYSQVIAQGGNDGFDLLQKPYSIDQLSRVLWKAGSWRRRQRSRKSTT